MLNILANPQELSRNPGGKSGLWHDGTWYTPSIGCTACFDRAVCGRLQLDSALYESLRFCCQNPSKCDDVCRNKPDDFVRRVREIGGFELDNVARAAVLDAPS